MPWFNVDDAWHRHPKVLIAGNAAAGLWARLGSYSAEFLTEGFVPTGIVRQYGTRAQISRLVKAGMLERCDGGYRVHDYLDANRSRATVLAERAAATERKRRSRAPPREASHEASHAVTDARSKAKAKAKVLAPEHAAAATELSPAAAAAVEIYAIHRVMAEGRNVRSSTRYAASIRTSEIAGHGDRLATIDPDADPVEACVAMFGISRSDAIRADVARRNGARL